MSGGRSMNRDRGLLKWGAFKIPEHENLLSQTVSEMQKEPQYDLTDWELEDLQLEISNAAEQEKLITLTIRRENDFIDMTGTIKRINRDANCLILDTLTGSKQIPFSALFKACLEE